MTHSPRSHCYTCKLPVEQCICDAEDWEDDGETSEDLNCSEFEGDENYAEDETIEEYESDVDALGRNYSDADPGL